MSGVGGQLGGRSVPKKFNRYSKKAGINPGIHFYSLRHTGVSWIIGQGVSPSGVLKIAGHSSAIVTQIYTHVEDRDFWAAVGAFDEAGGT